MIKKGIFLTIEGIDGAGKGTHLDWLVLHLINKGFDVIQTREPGGTPLGEKLREIMLSEYMDSDTELFLAYTIRQQHLTEVIMPALEAGKVVISDRFEDSTYAYQGGGRGINSERIDQISRCCIGPRPDITLFFDLPIEVAAERMVGTRNLDRFEKEGKDFHQRVRDGFLIRALENPNRICILDSTKSIEDVRIDLAKIFENMVP